MTKYVIILVCMLTVSSISSQEKKSLNDIEYARIKNIISKNNIILEGDNRDTLTIDGKNYILFMSPIDILNGASEILYNKPQGIIGPGLHFRKRYILKFDIIDSLLFITNFYLAPDYEQNGKCEKDVVESIETLLGKKVEKGRIKVDWLIVENCRDCGMTLYVTDDSRKIYSLEFEKGKLIRKALQKDVQTKRSSLPRLEDLKIKK